MEEEKTTGTSMTTIDPEETATREAAADREETDLVEGGRGREEEGAAGEEDFEAAFAEAIKEQVNQEFAWNTREKKKKKSNISLIDDETAMQLEAEGKGFFITVGEFSKVSRISRKTIVKKINQGRFHVKKIPYQGSPTGYRYMVWVKNTWLKKKLIELSCYEEIEATVTRLTLEKLFNMSKIDRRTYEELSSGRDMRFQLKFLIPEKTLSDLIKNSTVQLG